MSQPVRLLRGKDGAELRDYEAEREVLGCVLVANRDRAKQILALVRPHEWAAERHRDIARGMGLVLEQGAEVEPAALAAALQDIGAWERCGGPRCLGELLDRAGTVTNAEHYAQIVRSKAALRRLAALGTSLQVAAADGIDDLPSAIEQARKALDDVSDTSLDDPDDLSAWRADRYLGPAEEVAWLVPEILARGEAHLLAAPGDSGKGMLVLELALQLASGIYETGRRAPFGRAILPLAIPCTCVLLSAEDTAAALHRRQQGLDPEAAKRTRAGDRFVALPLPSAGGQFDIIERDGGGFRASSRWLRMVERLSKLPDLGLVIIDPLACFVSLDIDAESAVAAKLMGEVSRAAAELNAAFLVLHHMRKHQQAHASVKTVDDLPTHESVRGDIRGVAALLNGVRMGYGIVPMPARYAKAVLTKLGERGELDAGKVYWGAVVKANGKVDRRPRLYVRADCGLLEDRTADIAVMGRLDDALKALVSPAKGDT